MWKSVQRKFRQEYGWMKPAIKRLDRRASVLGIKNLRTFLHEANEILAEGFLKAFGTEKRFKQLLHLMATPQVQKLLLQLLRQIPQSLKKDAQGDPRYSLLLKLINEADDRIEFSPFIALMLIWKDIDDSFEFIYQMTYKQFEVIDNLPGYSKLDEEEERTRVLIDAITRVANGLHTPYLQYIWQLQRILQKGTLGTPPEPGAITNEYINNHPEYKKLVLPEIVFIRNATGHDTNKYDPATKTRTLTNQDGTRQASYLAEDLERILVDAHQLTGRTFTTLLRLYAVRKITHVFETLLRVLPDLLKPNKQKQAQAEQQLNKQGHDLRRRMQPARKLYREYISK